MTWVDFLHSPQVCRYEGGLFFGCATERGTLGVPMTRNGRTLVLMTIQYRTRAPLTGTVGGYGFPNRWYLGGDKSPSGRDSPRRWYGMGHSGSTTSRRDRWGGSPTT